MSSHTWSSCAVQGRKIRYASDFRFCVHKQWRDLVPLPITYSLTERRDFNCVLMLKAAGMGYLSVVKWAKGVIGITVPLVRSTAATLPFPLSRTTVKSLPPALTLLRTVQMQISVDFGVKVVNWVVSYSSSFCWTCA